jgi:hypothetical protein
MTIKARGVGFSIHQSCDKVEDESKWSKQTHDWSGLGFTPPNGPFMQ